MGPKMPSPRSLANLYSFFMTVDLSFLLWIILFMLLLLDHIFGYKNKNWSKRVILAHGHIKTCQVGFSTGAAAPHLFTSNYHFSSHHLGLTSCVKPLWLFLDLLLLPPTPIWNPIAFAPGSHNLVLYYVLSDACWTCFSNWILSSLRVMTCKCK